MGSWTADLSSLLALLAVDQSPGCMGLSVGQLTTWQLASPQREQSVSQMKGMIPL